MLIVLFHVHSRYRFLLSSLRLQVEARTKNYSLDQFLLFNVQCLVLSGLQTRVNVDFIVKSLFKMAPEHVRLP